MTPEPKAPAAVVYLERPDGRVLALTRGLDFGDWHLPGGKWEPLDNFGAPSPSPADLRATACREMIEETGVHLEPASLHAVTDYTTRSGRPVRLFVAEPPAWCPEHFPRYPAGQPAWVPPQILTLAWASFAFEAAHVLRAVAAYRRRGESSIFPAQAAALAGRGLDPEARERQARGLAQSDQIFASAKAEDGGGR